MYSEIAKMRNKKKQISDPNRILAHQDIKGKMLSPFITAPKFK